MTATMPAQPVHAEALPRHVHVAVVGSGFAGITTALALSQAGEHDYVVLERAATLGGTWRDNSYPGCACDVPSHLYSLREVPNPNWTRTFSPQPEIQAYLLDTATRFGVVGHLHCNTEVAHAQWDDSAQHWDIQTNRGTLSADVLVLGTGGLSEPKLPDLHGLDSFAGTTFHSATWNHEHQLAGERVAVIGTGASAIQFVPIVASAAGHMTLFQRTPPWVLPRRDRAIRPAERWAFRRFPITQRLNRAAIFWGREGWLLGFGHPKLMRGPERQALRFLAHQVPDPTLRAKLTPHYRLGCKRVLLSNHYYRALTGPTVDVETNAIVAVRPHAVVTVNAAGVETEHPVDTIIFGTGFHVTDPPIAHRVVGRDGRSLAEHWAATGMQALNGITVAGFPNLFFLVGPNTGLGHTSITLMIEAQVDYLVDALTQMTATGLGAIEVRPETQARFNTWVQRRLQGTVWNAGGCSSWYLDRHGHNTVLWPTFVHAFRRRLAQCELGDYQTTTKSSRIPEAVA